MDPQHDPDPCVIVIFGASGDLTRRKLVPALFDLFTRGRLPPHMAILGVSRSHLSDEAFRERLETSAKEFATGFDADRWAEFARRLHYHAADATSPSAYKAIGERIEQVANEQAIQERQGQPNILFYLAVAPGLYTPIIESLGGSGMIAEGKRWCSLDPSAMPWQRIVIEKPFGRDLSSAQALNRTLGRVFEEEMIYRIDHYLGKELVQNILVTRFANAIFEPIWNRRYIDCVQVTAAESIGVGSRAGTFFDTTGALRDMIQSHLLQVVALVGMEPPAAYDADAIMREKIDLFHSARPIDPEQAPRHAAIGRYGPSPDEPAYAQTPGVDPDRRTETYAAVRLEFDNWRWAGVPFYIRSGKGLARKLTEVVIQFRLPPTNLFHTLAGESAATILGDRPNRLVINIAPSEGICLHVLGKVPGSPLQIGAAALDMDYVERFGGEPIEAYAPLLLDVIRGDRTLFKHRDEVEGGWRICDPFINSTALRDSIQTYPRGSWGPASADDLIVSDGFTWHNPDPPA